MATTAAIVPKRIRIICGLGLNCVAVAWQAFRVLASGKSRGQWSRMAAVPANLLRGGNVGGLGRGGNVRAAGGGEQRSGGNGGKGDDLGEFHIFWMLDWGCFPCGLPRGAGVILAAGPHPARQILRKMWSPCRSPPVRSPADAGSKNRFPSTSPLTAIRFRFIFRVEPP